MNIGMFFCIVACLSFGMLCYAFGEELNQYIRGKLRIRKALENQRKAVKLANDLIVFDQTMTREQLIRDWEEM